jgi:hypothetical protein
MADPQNIAALDDLRNFLGYDVRGAVSNPADIQEAIERYYADKQESIEDVINSLDDEAAFVFVTTNKPRHGVHVPVASAHDVERRDRLNARMNANIAGVETNLPCIRRRDNHIAANELAPMHVVPKGQGRGKQADTATAFVENTIGLLERCYTGPFEVSRIEGDILSFGDNP